MTSSTTCAVLVSARVLMTRDIDSGSDARTPADAVRDSQLAASPTARLDDCGHMEARSSAPLMHPLPPLSLPTALSWPPRPRAMTPSSSPPHPPHPPTHHLMVKRRTECIQSAYAVTAATAPTAPAVRNQPAVARNARAADSSSRPKWTPAACIDLVGHLRVKGQGLG